MEAESDTAKRREAISKHKKDKQERDAYENRIKSLEKDLDTARAENSKLKQNYNELKQSYNELKQTNEDLQETLLKNIENAQDQIEKLVNEKIELQQENQELKHKNQELLARTANVFERKENLNPLLQKATPDQQSNEEIERKNKELLRENSELRERILALEANIRALTEKAERIRDDNSSFAKKNVLLERKISEIDEKNGELQSKNRELLSQKNLLEEKVSSLENSLKRKDQKIQEFSIELSSKAENQKLEADNFRAKEIAELSQENEALRSQVNELKAKLVAKDTAHENDMKQFSESIEKDVSLFMQKLHTAGLVDSDPAKPSLKTVPNDHKAQAFKKYLNLANIFTREKIITDAFVEVLTENGIYTAHNAQLKDVRATLSSKLAQKPVVEEKKVNIEPSYKPNKPIIINQSEEAPSGNTHGTKGKIAVLANHVNAAGADEVITVKKPKPVIIQENGANNLTEPNGNKPEKKKGNGKKSLAKAVAKEAGASFFGISAAKFISKWDGNNEDKVKTLFATARANRPAIIFIDEIEDITWAARGPQSEIASKVKIEIILQFYEGDYTGLFVVIATSFPWDIDAAIRKRLELRIYVPLPDCKEREELIKAMLKGAESSVNDEEIKELSEWTEGFSRSDLSSLVRDARFEIFRRLQKTSYFKQAGTNLEGEPIFTTCDPDVEGSTKLSAEELKPGQIQLNPTSMEDFLTVLKTIKPATFPTDVQKHEKFREDFGNRSLDGSLL